jgi:hypothetical protein
MAVVLLGQFAAFQGTLPAPLFLSLTAAGLVLVSTARQPYPAW